LSNEYPELRYAPSSLPILSLDFPALR